MSHSLVNQSYEQFWRSVHETYDQLDAPGRRMAQTLVCQANLAEGRVSDEIARWKNDEKVEPEFNRGYYESLSIVINDCETRLRGLLKTNRSSGRNGHLKNGSVHAV